ncbi:MAG TPA: MFS transporter [Fimbriimonadaceae bacterium]|nr:MFS transporter [Fimbriimonadaceae bacterium]
MSATHQTSGSLPGLHPVADLTTSQHLALSTLWAAMNFVLGALLMILLPGQIREMVSVQESGARLGFLVSFGAIPALAVPLIVGPLSDRCRSALGRRRPYILWGIVVAIGGLAILYLGGSQRYFLLFMGGFFVLQIGMNVAMAAYSGFIPDLVPVTQRGLASGFMAIMSQAGTLVGVVLTGFLAQAGLYLISYAILAGILVTGLLVTMKWVRETPLTEAQPRLNWIEHFRSLWIDPRLYPDFAWVWLTRALVMLGFYALLPFLPFYLADVIRVENWESMFGKLIGVVLVGSALSAVVAGRLSDRVGRKRIVYLANGLMALMCLGFALCNTLEQVVGVAIIFGLGYGAYISVDWALGTDVLPKAEDAAKDMAVWHVSMTLPQSIAALPAGMLLAAFGVQKALDKDGVIQDHYTEAGFDWLFAAAAICLALGALLLRNVKRAR